ncbi:heat stress transcription factor b-2a [Phtheirospermum japonicum]|uniref:Heat stress transcription factor b-2a n=1 Tax=Phtheirospermum japonicum TaxID=374723 RepID=A0A830BVU0_9LAMI|nr:heat stress transcription factor b-2a [Phtheirospermum japonicum]
MTPPSMTSSPGMKTDLPSSFGIRRSSLGICCPNISSTTIFPVLFASSTLTDLGKLCPIDGNSPMNSFEGVKRSFFATSSAGKWLRRRKLRLPRRGRCRLRYQVKSRCFHPPIHLPPPGSSAAARRS